LYCTYKLINICGFAHAHFGHRGLIMEEVPNISLHQSLYTQVHISPPFQSPILTKYIFNPPHNLEVPSRTSLRIPRPFAAPTGEAHLRERVSVF
jgi:hypothetical protein